MGIKKTCCTSHATVKVACALRVSEWFAFVFWNVSNYVFECFHMCMQLFRVLELAPSFFVLHFVLDMPMRWCHCCKKWIETKFTGPDEKYRCSFWDCVILRIDWAISRQLEMKWARTTDCMLMLATKSLQDRQSQKWCAFYNSKKAYGIHCSAWW